MLFLGESAHRRFPLMSSQFAVRRSRFAVAGCHLISRISPIGELFTCIESPENDARTLP
jgi:hypothetical protein